MFLKLSYLGNIKKNIFFLLNVKAIPSPNSAQFQLGSGTNQLLGFFDLIN
jgi:hypothetical protein